MLALGVTFVIITAGIDLSVGTVMTFSAVMTGVFITDWKLPVPIGVLAGLATGAVVRASSTAVHLQDEDPALHRHAGHDVRRQGAFAGHLRSEADLLQRYAGLRQTSPWVRSLARSSPDFQIPNAVLIMFLAAIIAGLILSKTVLGRYAFAIGSNEEATRLSGVNVDGWKTAIYTLCGLFAGLAGVLMAARLNSAQPALGTGYELDAIAAVVIGGTSLSGGEGTILGTIIGAFVISTLTNGLRILSVPQEWQIVVTGVIVIGAVYLDILRRRRQ